MYLQSEHKVWLATGEGPVYLEPGMANRHGLIAGATGTGKTVTLKVLAGWVLLHQTLRPIEALGCALVFLAVILSQTKSN